jgi:RND family efflux transporter MFP subunit
MQNLTMKLIAAASIVAAITAASCGGRDSSPHGVAASPLDVQFAVATMKQVPRVFEAGGVVRARTTATLVSRIVAEVREVLVRPGDRVKAGQVLIRLDARDLQAAQARAEASLRAAEQAVTAATTARQGAEANLALATATHKRVAELRAKNSATPHELDQAFSGLRGAEAQAQGAQAGILQAEAGAEAARAGLKSASVALSWASITAPFDGVVTEKLVEPGNTAAPGASLMTVEDTKGFRLEVTVDETRAAAIDRARPVAVTVDAGAEGAAAGPTVLAGTIAEFARALDPASHAFLVKIDLPEGANVRSGMFGRARFAGPVAQSLVVPASSVVRRGQVAAVFVAGADNRATLRMVQLAGESDAGQEVVAGLEAGERVVVSPAPALVDGAAVREARR